MGANKHRSILRVGLLTGLVALAAMVPPGS